jgi:hypothetical protein
MVRSGFVNGWKVVAIAACAIAIPIAVQFGIEETVISSLTPPKHTKIAVFPRIDGDPVALLEELPTAPPSATVPTLVESGDAAVEARVKALAAELGRMWTRDPEQLVRAIENATKSVSSPPPDTLLLAIAHAETNGHILDVSEAGAVGLSQATPIAYLEEGFTGALFMTDDYLIGARAYIMKKPLGDADTIASLMIERPRPATLERAKKLLSAAKRLRRVGVDDLQLLRPYASEGFFQRIEAADRHNAAVLRELQRLLDEGDLIEIKRFRDRIRDDYRAMKRLQIVAWKEYQHDLIEERDRRIESHYKLPASVVKSADAYEAGDWLGETFDERFSPKAMARFLVVHLDRKSNEARKLKRPRGRTVEQLTAGLYNGGSHNVQRMIAGLITRLPETERYMRKVPATRSRLDAIVAGSGSGNSIRTLR